MKTVPPVTRKNINCWELSKFALEDDRFYMYFQNDIFAKRGELTYMQRLKELGLLPLFCQRRD